MGEAAKKIDDLEVRVEAAIALCDGDVRAALAAALIYNEFLERKLDEFRNIISSGYTCRKVTPAQKASDKLDKWRGISSGPRLRRKSELTAMTYSTRV
jgi:hypothetical protein